MTNPAVIAKLEEMGVEPNPLPAEKFIAILKNDLTKMKTVVETAKIKAE